MNIKKLAAAIQARQKVKKPVLMSDPDILSEVTEFVSSGCLPLDIIMGGGFPVGRITQIFGDFSSGKSLVAVHALKQTQDIGGITVMLDTEATGVSSMIDAVGLDRDSVLYFKPDMIEEIFDIIIKVIDTVDEQYAADLKKNSATEYPLTTIVWDSIAATTSEAELDTARKEGLRKAAGMADHARLLSKMFRILPRMISEKRIAFICTNQIRAKLGVLYGEKEDTFGGKAVKFYSSVMLKMDALTTAYSAENRTVKAGTPYMASKVECRAFVYKNKVAAPFGYCDFPVIFGQGIDEAGAILWWLKNTGVISMAGAWSKLVLETGEVLKFQASGWPMLYILHEDEIKSLVIHNAGFSTE